MRDELLIAILAAGASQRLGQPKQLVDVNGEPLLRRQCRVAIEARVAPVAAICGCQADTCIAQIADLPVTIRRNEQWREGIASSIREAVGAAIEIHAGALLILHGDQYRVTAEDLRGLHAAWIASDSSMACRSRHADYTGPPVILPAALFGKLLKLRGDEGARPVLSGLDAASLIEVTMPNAVHDLDLPAQLYRPSVKNRGTRVCCDPDRYAVP
ncbi:MAG: nucleotidyltransferase family protein [Phycisphaerales bacterium]|nr:nucleotidyltransferase family protein [Phycisphaerales bacterium]